jgi:hypothetical protein
MTFRVLCLYSSFVHDLRKEGGGGGGGHLVQRQLKAQQSYLKERRFSVKGPFLKNKDLTHVWTV